MRPTFDGLPQESEISAKAVVTNGKNRYVRFLLMMPCAIHKSFCRLAIRLTRCYRDMALALPSYASERARNW